jgi:hypothetical protein
MAKVLCVLYDDPVDGYPVGRINSITLRAGIRGAVLRADFCDGRVRA